VFITVLEVMMKVASFMKFQVQEEKIDDFVAELQPIVESFLERPGVISLTMAKTGDYEVMSCCVYDSMLSLKSNADALKESIAIVLPMISKEEGSVERYLGDVVAS